MKQLCYLMLALTVCSNCLKISLKKPLMPNYNENFANFAASVFVPSHSHNKNLKSVSLESLDQSASKLNLHYNEIEKLGAGKKHGIDEAIQKHANLNKLEETLKKEKAHIDLEDSLAPKPLEVRKFLVK